MTATAPTYPGYPDQPYPQANYPQQQQPYYQPPAPQYSQQPYPGQVAYVGQPNSGYSTPSGNEQPKPQQQQQQTVIINASTPSVVAQYPHLVQSYSGHIAFACVVFWCCGWLFGGIAFFLALSAQSNQPSDPETARRLGRASLGVSIAGVAVGIAIIIGLSVGLSVAASSSSSSTCCSYGHCYTC